MTKLKITTRLVSVVLGCVLSLASPANSQSNDDMIHLAPQFIDESDSEGSPALGKLAYSKEVDQCAKAYFVGDKER